MAATLALRAATVVAAIGGSLFVLLTVTGYHAGEAIHALWSGSLGSGYAFWSGTLVRAVPLLLAGTAVSLAFTAGILNIGAEGQLLAGAAAAAATALWLTGPLGALPGRPALLLALVAGAAAGAAWAGVAAVLRRRFGVLEVISTIMLNFVALYAVGYLVRGPLQEPLRIYPQSSTLPPAGRLPVLLPGSRLHAGFALAVIAAVAAWWVLRATAAGFRVRVAGASPTAAASAGLIDVAATTRRVFLVSGALAGVAGAVEVTGVTYALYENLSPGYGYTAIAVALLARLNPLAILASATLFGALNAGAAAMQRDAGVPAAVVGVVEGAVILMILGAERWWNRTLGTRSFPWGAAADTPATDTPATDTPATDTPAGERHPPPEPQLQPAAGDREAEAP